MGFSFATRCWGAGSQQVPVEGLWASNENLAVPRLEVGGSARERALGQRTGEGVTSAAPDGPPI